MSDLKIQGEVQLSAEGAESALDRVAEKAGQMASRLQTEAGKAGKAVDGIGAGASKGADEFTRAESRIVESVKRATRNLQELNKTASQKIELRIADRGLDPSRFEPMLAKLREMEAAQVRVAAGGAKMGGGLQNASYQIQDFVTQVNMGTDATRALSMQLPQMLVGFGAIGAGIGVVAALLPNIISMFGNSAAEAKKFSDAVSDFDKSLSGVGQATRSFDMENLYEQFNKSSEAVRAATLEQIKFQREYIRTTQMVAEKKIGEALPSLSGRSIKDQAENLAGDLGLTESVASEILPVLRGLKSGTEDVGLAFEQIGVSLLAGNEKAIELAGTLANLAKSERDAYAASAALSEAQQKMAKGHVETKKEAESAAKAIKSVGDEFGTLMARINAKDSGVDAGFWKDLNTLHAGYQKGRVGAEEYTAAVRALTNQQKFAQDSAKAVAAAEEAVAKAREKSRAEAASALERVQKEVEQQRQHNAEIGLTAAQLAVLTDERMADAIATEQQAFARAQLEGADLAELKLIDEKIAAMRELRNLRADGAARQAVADSAKAAADDWKKFSDDIERSLTDALMRGFESGNSFGKNFVDTLKNTLKTAALKVVVQAIVDPVMGGVQALGGGVGGAAGKTGGLLSTGSSLMNLGSSSAAAAGLATQFAYSGIGASLGLSTAAGAGYAAPVYAAGGQLLSAGSTGVAAGGMTAGGSALASMASAAPYVLAALAVADAVGLFGKRGGPQQGQYGTLGAAGYSSQFTMSGGDALNNQQLATAAYAQAQALFSLGGKSASGLTLQQGYKLDPQGSAAGVAYRNLVLDGKTITGGTFDGNRGAQWVGGSGDAEGAATYLAKLTSAEIEALVKAIDDTKLTDLMGKLKANFGDLAGAMEKYGTAQTRQQAMIAAVLTDEEQQKRTLAAATESVSSAFASLNLEMPNSTAAFRALIDGIDLTTQAGQSMLEQLDAIGPGFLILAEAMRAADQVRQEWQDKLDVMSGKTTAQQLERQRLLASTTDAATKALMGQVWALEDQKSASEAAAAASEKANEAAAAASEKANEAAAAARAEAQAAMIELTDAAYSALERAVDAQRKVLDTQRQTAQAAQQAASEQVRAVDSVFNALDTSIERLYGDVAGGSMSAAQGSSFIDDALRAAKTSGYLPDAAELSTAIAAVEKTLGAGNYASAVESEQARLVLAGKLSQLNELTRGQLDIAKGAEAAAEGQLAALDAQLAALDETLATARNQLDVLRGIDVSILSVAEALSRFGSQAQREAASGAGAQVSQSAPTPTQTHVTTASGGVLFPDKLGRQVYDYARENGYGAAQTAALFGNIGGMPFGQSDLYDWLVGRGLPLPKFAAGGFHTGGLRLVGENGPELEVTGPSRIFSAQQTRGLLGGDALAGEVRALREENRELRARMESLLSRIEDNTRQTSRAVNGLGGAPMLVEVA